MNSYVRWTTVVVTLVLLAVWVVVAVQDSIRKFRNETRNESRFHALTILLWCVGVGNVWVVKKYGEDPFAGLSHVIGLHAAQLVTALAVVSIGGLAYLFKRLNQLWYGVTELFFAAAAAFNVALSMKPNETVLSQWATLGGTAYVVARGLGNISDARRAKSLAMASEQTSGAK